jgi:hypothetical protein
MYTRLTLLSVLALPLIATSTPADAQSKSRNTSVQTSNAAIEARHKCFLEAQAQIPADPNDPNITQSRRLPIYTACARRAGVRP